MLVTIKITGGAPHSIIKIQLGGGNYWSGKVISEKFTRSANKLQGPSTRLNNFKN